MLLKFCCLLVLVSICQSRPLLGSGLPASGTIQLFSVTAVNNNYVINYVIDIASDAVIKLPRVTSNAVVSNNLHNNQKVIIWRYNNTELLFVLTDNVIAVYRYGLETHYWIYEDSIPLEAGLKPWYLVQSSQEDVDVMNLVYRDSNGFTDIYFNDIYHPTFNPDDLVIILKTLDPSNIIAGIKDNGQYISIEDFDINYPSSIPPSLVGDCDIFNQLYPLDPIATENIYFTVSCTTANGDSRHYFIAYDYAEDRPTVTAHSIPVGIPLNQDKWLTVTGNDRLITVYDVTAFNTAQGQHQFTAPIQDISFHGDGLLTVLIEDTNVIAIKADEFVQSRGLRGLTELPNTNIGPCVPTCLPVTTLDNSLAVVSLDESVGYSIVLFDKSSLKAFKRFERLPERPYGLVYIEYSKVLPTLLPPSIPQANILQTIAGSTVGGLVFVLLVVGAIFGIHVLVYKRGGNRRGHRMIDSPPRGNDGVHIPMLEFHSEGSIDLHIPMLDLLPDSEGNNDPSLDSNPDPLVSDADPSSDSTLDLEGSVDDPMLDLASVDVPQAPIEEEARPVIREEVVAGHQVTQEGIEGTSTVMLV